MEQPISFIMPSRNNLKYFEWSYESIRRNLGYDHEICFADDNSTDGTWNAVTKMAETDPNLKIIRNDNGFRVGHTILYDKLINEVATNDIVMIFHCDMYATKDLVSNMLKYLKKGTIVSATRVEPPLHPSGVEKIIQDFGVEPESFNQSGFETWYDQNLVTLNNIYTHGIFAPFMFYKDDFISIGGHDALFCPQSKEDSDLFNRMKLKGYSFIQSWDAIVYHLTSRGSRFNPTITSVGTNSSEWSIQNLRSHKNFIRKWGTTVQHDEYMLPIIVPKHKLTFVVTGLHDIKLLDVIEPYADVLYTDAPKSLIEQYVSSERSLYDIKGKFKSISDYGNSNKVGTHVTFNVSRLNSDDFKYLTNMCQIITNTVNDDTELGEFEVGNLDVYVYDTHTYEHKLVYNTNQYILHQHINYNLPMSL